MILYIGNSGCITHQIVRSTMGWIQQSVWMLALVFMDVKVLMSKTSHSGMIYEPTYWEYYAISYDFSDTTMNVPDRVKGIIDITLCKYWHSCVVCRSHFSYEFNWKDITTRHQCRSSTKTHHPSIPMVYLNLYTNKHYSHSIIVHRWSEALHGVSRSPGVHFGGQVTRQLGHKNLLCSISLDTQCNIISASDQSGGNIWCVRWQHD